MRYIFVILFLLYSLQTFSQNIEGIHIIDSISTKSMAFNSKHMIQGGYELLGFVESGKDFEIKNLKNRRTEYMYEYYIFLESNESLNESKLDYSEELIDDIDIPITKRIDQVDPPEEVNDINSFSLGGNKLKIIVNTDEALGMPAYYDVSEVVEKINGEFKSYTESLSNQKDLLNKYYNPKEELNKAYPVLIYNVSDSIVFIDTQESWVYMIQEAQDEKGVWKPIEYHDFQTVCGNSYSYSFLLPDYAVVSKIYAYEGEFKTMIRVRVMTQNKVYFSNEFEGSINRSQFSIPKGLEKRVSEEMFFKIK